MIRNEQSNRLSFQILRGTLKQKIKSLLSIDFSSFFSRERAITIFLFAKKILLPKITGQSNFGRLHNRKKIHFLATGCYFFQIIVEALLYILYSLYVVHTAYCIMLYI